VTTWIPVVRQPSCQLSQIPSFTPEMAAVAQVSAYISIV
jgi:hypothetical protein